MKIKLFFIFLFFMHASLWAQKKYTLSGTVFDASNGESLPGVNFVILDSQTGTSTNEYGFYSLTLPEGKYTVSIIYLGYKSITETVVLDKNIQKDYRLSPETIQLSDVNVVADKSDRVDIRKPQMSLVTLPVSTVKKLPVLIGEVDILKTLQFLPGVSNAGEMSSGFNVRGGAADQNLILLDEATVFNASHLFGFISVFNADAIRDMKLYKGGIPARYGGRVSSVLDIYQKDGNSNRFGATGGIGLLSSRLLAEGPFMNGKGSFLVGGRASYAHLFLKLSNNKNSAYFYDLNTKLSYRFDRNNKLYVSGYFGRDMFDLNSFLKNVYGNALFNVRWNHLFSEKLFSNLSLIYSDYYYGFGLSSVDFQWDSDIKNMNIKYDFRHYVSEKIKLSYGIQGLYYVFNPGKLYPTSSESFIKEKILPHKYALETGIYADAEHAITSSLTLSYGVRLSSFLHLGEQDIHVYENNQNVRFNRNTQTYEKGTPAGQLHYGKGKVIDRFSNFEPRLSLACAINDKSSVKASYTRTAQYLHLISNTSSPTPLDIWTPSNRFLKPQRADQYAVGFASNLADNKYSLEVETYYKTVDNRLEYIDGADLIANEAVEQVVLNAQGRAYGLELFLRKNSGRLTGWIGYTVSKSEQKTPGRTAEEIGINHGEWYNTAYDKPHDLSVTAMYRLNPQWSFGGVFALQTGLPTNFPVGKYDYFGMTIPNYSKRNEYRLPTYHRLDLSVVYTPAHKSNKRWKSEWVLGIYNVYNRKNASSIFFRRNDDTQRNEAVKLSIFGIVPSITYNFTF